MVYIYQLNIDQIKSASNPAQHSGVFASIKKMYDLLQKLDVKMIESVLTELSKTGPDVKPPVMPKI